MDVFLYFCDMNDKKQRILVVDDEQDLCDILSFNLTAADYAVQVATSASEALALEVAKFDLILLDVMMPGMSGYDLARRLKQDKQTSSIPIIFLTALGADDYIAKPFSVREVVARVKAVMARVAKNQAASSSTLCYQGLMMDLVKKTVEVDGDLVSLTRTEFDILRFLLAHQGQVFSRQDILDKVWPQDVVVTDRTVDVNITRMRKKIGRYSSCIVTRHGFGYLFIA